MQLDSARAKVDRAREHFEAFVRLEQDFTKAIGSPVDATYQMDGATIFRRRDLPGVPGAANMLIGDCIQDLRSALEHAVYSLSIAAEPTFERTSFPICLTRQAFETQRSDIRFLDTAHQAFIERIQPFKMPATTAERSLFWRLHDLARVDRHRTIHVLLAVVRAEYVERLTGASNPSTPATIDFMTGGGAQPGDILLRLPPTDANSIAFKPNWDLVMTFEETGDWVEPDLRAMVGFVSAVVAEMERDVPTWPPTVLGWD